MKSIADLILLLAALLSVFFVAGLYNVPKRVRLSVMLVGPCFLLTFLLHYRYPEHVDYGLIGVSVALTLSAVFGFLYISKTPLSKKDKIALLKRFATGFALSAVAVALVSAMIVNVHEKAPSVSPTSTKSPPVITPGDTTQDAINEFNRLSNEK